jgi:2'-5' RNA ligase
VRLFLAVNLPERARRGIREAAAPLREAAPDGAWVREENLHVTLKFLGDVDDETRVAALREALSAAVGRHRAFDVALAGAGAFPNLRAPRIVWFGMEREPRLELLHHDVETACAALGYEVDGRPFRPHVTLARLRGALAPPAARALAAAARGVRWSADVTVGSVDLMRSTLGAGGSRYDLLHAAPLGER